MLLKKSRRGNWPAGPRRTAGSPRAAAMARACRLV